MKLHQTLNPTRIEVVCNHPDDSSRCYIFVIEENEEENFPNNEEEYEKELRKAVEEKVNPHGYWHEVRIFLFLPIGCKEFLREI